jgi:hypothetical protein
MPTHDRHAHEVIRALNDAINTLQQQIVDDAVPPAFGESRRVQPTTADNHHMSSPEEEIIQALNERIFRLGQVRDWIEEDTHLAHLIDSVIGRQVLLSERRQARFNTALNGVFLILGWMLSLVGTPATLAMYLTKH